MLTFLLFLTIAFAYLVLLNRLREQNHGEQATDSGNPAELVLARRNTNDHADFAPNETGTRLDLPLQATNDGDPAEIVL